MTTPGIPSFGPDSSTARFGLEGYDATTYGESFADVYDDWYDELGDDDFMAALVAMLPGTPARILELGVGTGRLIAKMRAARVGIDDTIIGVDSSAAMLARARQRLGDGIDLVEADFSVTLPDGPFDLVFVGYNTLFNLPDDSALLSCMALVAERLAPGGSFVVDATCPSEPIGDPGRTEVDEHVGIRTMSRGTVVLTASRHDATLQRIVGQFVEYVDGEKVRLRPWSVRYWHPHQLDDIARSAGLVLVSRAADGVGTPFTRGGNRHISHYRAPAGNL